MFARLPRLSRLSAALVIGSLGASLACAGGTPNYGDNRGPAPKEGHGTDGKSYRENTYGQVGTGATLPGALGGSIATVPEGLMNSGSFGVPAPGSGIDVLHQDEMRQLRLTYQEKKAKVKEAKAKTKDKSGAKDHGHEAEHADEATTAPRIVISPAELTSPLNKAGVVAPKIAKRSIVRDHAVAADPNTPGQGGARRDRSVPSTTAAPRLPAYPRKSGESVAVPEANVAGVAWGRPAADNK
jgi:hypothetical protein